MNPQVKKEEAKVLLRKALEFVGDGFLDRGHDDGIDFCLSCYEPDYRGHKEWCVMGTWVKETKSFLRK